MTTVPLAELRFGHEMPDGSLNSRRSGREARLPELGASILAHGLIHPLVVVERAGEFYVVDGNRRLAAMRKMVEDGQVASPNEPVEVVVRDETDVDARETSLAANIEAEPLHPVDAYEAFAALSEEGLSVASIATRFGLSPRQVDQRLALGRLAPAIREAWRSGKIGEGDARQFAVLPAYELQETAFAGCLKRGHFADWLIRQEAGLEDGGGGLKLVGVDAYLAAGGRLTADLFDDEPQIADPAILAALASAKVKEHNDDYLEDGWKWVGAADDLPTDQYSWPRLPEPDGGYTAEQKALRGVVLRITYEGTVEARLGVVHPNDVKAATAPKVPDADEPVEEGVGPEPKAVAEVMFAAQTMAIADAMAAQPRHALRLLCVALMGALGTPICVKGSGAECLSSFQEHAFETHFPNGIGDIGEMLARLEELSDPQAQTLAATLIASAVDGTLAARSDVWNGKGVTAEGVAAVMDYLGAPALKSLVERTFDPAAYFDGAKKVHALLCIEECMGAAVAKQWAGRKKGDIAGFAAEVATQRRWLPAAIRPAGYAPEIPDPPTAMPKGEDLDPSEAPGWEPPKVNKPQREALIAMHELGAFDADSARPSALEKDERAKALNPQSVGALVGLGLAERVKIAGPTGKRTAYHLTAEGRPAARFWAGARADAVS